MVNTGSTMSSNSSGLVNKDIAARAANGIKVISNIRGDIVFVQIDIEVPKQLNTYNFSHQEKGADYKTFLKSYHIFYRDVCTHNQ